MHCQLRTCKPGADMFPLNLGTPIFLASIHHHDKLISSFFFFNFYFFSGNQSSPVSDEDFKSPVSLFGNSVFEVLRCCILQASYLRTSPTDFSLNGTNPQLSK